MTGPAPKLAVAASRWGVPDPRDEAAYDKLDGLTLPGWAWQFLRRNPVYREHWQDHERFGLWAPVTPWGDPEAPPNEAPPFVAQVTPMIGVSALLNRIGLEGAPEPEHIQLEANQVAVTFDLGRGLDDQLALAKEHLKFLQQQLLDAGLVTIIEPRARKEWASYLRLLDAEDAGLSDDEIMQLLFPDVDSRERQRVSLRNHRKRAHDMRDDGYKQIACVASK